MIKLKHPVNKNEPVAVGSRQYQIDGLGQVLVHEEDAPILIQTSGFAQVGIVDSKEEIVRLPKSREEVLDLLKAWAFTPDDLRKLADEQEAQMPRGREFTGREKRWLEAGFAPHANGAWTKGKLVVMQDDVEAHEVDQYLAGLRENTAETKKPKVKGKAKPADEPDGEQ